MKTLLIVIVVLVASAAQAEGPTLKGTLEDPTGKTPVPVVIKPVNPVPDCCGAVPLKDRKGDCCFRPAVPK